MQMNRRAKLLSFAIASLTLGMSTGCQTWINGQTLPSPHYLENHPPQYFPQEPAFPLTKELAYQEETAGLLTPRDQAGVVGAAPVPGVAPGLNPIPAPGPRR